jgi:hypothetical protein
MLVVHGKHVPIADLSRKVKAGDKVTLKYTLGGDLYAKRITKK